MCIRDSHYGHHAAEQPVVRVDADGTEQDIVFLIDNGGDICHNSHIIMTDDAQRDGVLFLSLIHISGFP